MTNRPSTPLTRRRFIYAGTAASLALPTWSARAAGDIAGGKPISLVVSYPAGGGADLMARLIAPKMAEALVQPVVVENKPGASGNIAADLVAKATDDHTLGVVINGNLTSAKLLNPKLSFDPAKDFSLLSLLATAPLVLVTQASQPAGTEFFTAARNAGNKWNYGSVGIGSVGHLGMEYLKGRAGNFGAVHVPYNGNPAVMNALLAGQVQMALIPPGLALAQVRAGKLKAIGVTGGRSVMAPEVPPLRDAGVNMQDLEVWTALVGPAKLSKAATERLSREVPTLVREGEARQRLFSAGWQAQGGSPEALRLRVKSETSLLGGIILMQNIKLE